LVSRSSAPEHALPLSREGGRALQYVTITPMTLTAVWLNREEPEAPRLWITTDSRISDDRGPLVDQGNKLFVVPVVCREPDAQGFFTVPFFTQTVGLMCFGGSLIYNNVYASVIPLVTALIA
jgi:hypothetical protein